MQHSSVFLWGLLIVSACHAADGTDGTDGSNGTDGVDGADGVTSLLEIEDVPPGGECSEGGTKVTSGLDSNADGQLDPEEVSATRYVCNGPEGPGVRWQAVTGPSITAVPNTGYIIDAEPHVVVTLPADAEVGDAVEVVGSGPSGFSIAQRAGQIIRTAGLEGGAFSTRGTSYGTASLWLDIASSRDGTRLAAIDASGDLFVSADAGSTWRPRTTSASLLRITSSADGVRLIGAADDGLLYYALDSGAAFSPGGTGLGIWGDLVTSDDGARALAISSYFPSSLYWSNDGGATVAPTPFQGYGSNVAISSDGNTAYACMGYWDAENNVERIDVLLRTFDAGVHWELREPEGRCRDVATSSDGRRVVVIDATGRILTSIDSGTTWVERDPVRSWSDIAVSNDGVRIVALAGSGAIWFSSDAGESFEEHPSTYGVGQALAISGDGMRIAVAYLHGLVTAAPSPRSATTLGETGSVAGGRYDTIRLRYVGNGVFVVEDATGTFVIR